MALTNHCQPCHWPRSLDRFSKHVPAVLLPPAPDWALALTAPAVSPFVCPAAAARVHAVGRQRQPHCAAGQPAAAGVPPVQPVPQAPRGSTGGGVLGGCTALPCAVCHACCAFCGAVIVATGELLSMQHPRKAPARPCLCPGVLQSGSAPSPECQDVAEVVARLQARQGQQLWPREQPSLAHPVVPSAAAVALFVQTGACRGWQPKKEGTRHALDVWGQSD